MKDISPHDKSRCQPAEGSTKERTTADLHTDQVHNRFFRLETEAHGTFRTDVNALLADDAL